MHIVPIYTSAMQSKPTVGQINKMNWFPVCHKWRSIRESLGISKGVLEGNILATVPFAGLNCNSRCDKRTLFIKAMLIKWLRKDQGTGHSERTWITIAKAVKDVGLGEVALKLLEEGMCIVIDHGLKYPCHFITALPHQEQIVVLKPYQLLHLTIIQYSKAMSYYSEFIIVHPNILGSTILLNFPGQTVFPTCMY